jgi:hypothetical protein
VGSGHHKEDTGSGPGTLKWNLITGVILFLFMPAYITHP